MKRLTDMLSKSASSRATRSRVMESIPRGIGWQLVYFAGYAMWTYLTTPFLFVMDGVATEELQPWHENGETWRRLKVTFIRLLPQ